jgi:sterol desaturase/sphingolipid hydroxylase (fatty acid hydroxylase superfamily)
MQSLQASLASSSTILSAMLLLSLVEAASPLFARGAANRAHLAPNLALTLLTFATYAVLNAVLVAGLVWVDARDLGMLESLGIVGLPAALISVAALDFATYWGHVAMHKVPVLWRFHRVHHADPTLDVTTTLRQHPGEGVLRFIFAAAVAIPLGASPAVFALDRFTSGIFGLLEHANVRVPERIDTWLSLVVPWPNFHKLHHSREPKWTDTNYGNLVTLWDRLFGTYTPAHLATQVSYGLAEFDAPSRQTTAALLAAPFVRVARSDAAGVGFGRSPLASRERATRTGVDVHAEGRRSRDSSACPL